VSAPAVFFDRDGTIIEEVGYPSRPEQIRILAGAARGMKRLARAGFKLVVVTNQSGIARGIMSENDLDRFHEALDNQLTLLGAHVDAYYTCPHHPDRLIAIRHDLAVDCDCRKPKPGMILQAAGDLGIDLADSWMVGDTWRDIQAGQAAGLRTIKLPAPPSHEAPRPSSVEPPTAEAADFDGAADVILAARKRKRETDVQAAPEEPAVAEEPAAVEEPPVTEAPAVAEEPAAVEESPVAEAPAVAEEPAAVEEAPAVAEEPAAAEPPDESPPAAPVETLSAPPAVAEEPAAVEPPDESPPAAPGGTAPAPPPAVEATLAPPPPEPEASEAKPLAPQAKSSTPEAEPATGSCARCGQAVPKADVKAGKAAWRNGSLLCAECSAIQPRMAGDVPESTTGLLRAILTELRRTGRRHGTGGLSLARLFAYVLQAAAIFCAIVPTLFLEGGPVFLQVALFLQLLVVTLLLLERNA